MTPGDAGRASELLHSSRGRCTLPGARRRSRALGSMLRVCARCGNRSGSVIGAEGKGVGAVGEASDPAVVRFGLFEADLRAGELRLRGAKLRLQEQPFRALALLVERAGELVTRQELAAALWRDGTHVDFEQGIHTAIKKLRHVLRDSPARPRWIETVGRRGYRFIGEIESESHGAPNARALRAPTARPLDKATPAFVPGLTPFVGRETERRLLQERFDAARSGKGQVVLVTGEPGIGKSRLALELAADLGERPHGWLACRGSPQHPAAPFHPILQLLSPGNAGGSDRRH